MVVYSKGVYPSIRSFVFIPVFQVSLECVLGLVTVLFDAIVDDFDECGETILEEIAV